MHLGFDLRVKQLSDKLTEFVQISKELKMFNYKKFQDKAKQHVFLKAAEKARSVSFFNNSCVKIPSLFFLHPINYENGYFKVIPTYFNAKNNFVYSFLKYSCS